MSPLWYRMGARVRGGATTLGFLALIVGLLGNAVLSEQVFPRGLTLVLVFVGLGLLVVGLGSTFMPGAPAMAAREVASPVVGRWHAVNSPATRVPSHGLHSLGQTFAIDLAYEPADGARPAFGHGPAFRPSTDFPGFGQELRSPADAVVVKVRNSARDHRSRSNWFAYGYLMLEGTLRELAGPRHVLGNHVVLDLGDGCYALLAHLQRGSAAVRAGQRVRRGEVIARCGNTGNSTEPHLHFQLMDHRWPLIAAGLPFRFAGIDVPGNDEVMVANRLPQEASA